MDLIAPSVTDLIAYIVLTKNCKGDGVAQRSVADFWIDSFASEILAIVGNFWYVSYGSCSEVAVVHHLYDKRINK